MIGRLEYGPSEIATASRYFLLANSALNSILCIMLTKEYYSVVMKLLKHITCTRSGKYYLIVPTSAHFTRRKKLWWMMLKNQNCLVDPFLVIDLRESTV